MSMGACRAGLAHPVYTSRRQRSYMGTHLFSFLPTCLICKARSFPYIALRVGPHYALSANPRVSCWTLPSATAQCTVVEPEVRSLLAYLPQLFPKVGTRVNVLPWIACYGGRLGEFYQ